MKRKNKLILPFILLLLILFLITFLVYTSNNKTKNTIQDETDSNQKKIEEQVESLMEQMSLEEKIAQMLILTNANTSVDENLKETLSKIKPGGFIIMKDNITTFDQTKEYIADLKKYSEILPIIATDQEGGSVQRLQSLTDIQATNIPYMYDLGKTNDKDLAYQVGKVMAEEMRTLGVNVVFAPVLDIYSNENNTVIGKRSFGTSPDLVSKMALSLAKGLEDNEVIATYKHFPGHGDTTTDSHIDLPILDKSYQDLLQEELIPFEEAIKNNAKIIMVGHIALPEITKDETPASLSKKIITDILKEDMNYQGLVITDALNMKALTNYYSEEEIYTKAIEAGVDLLLMPKDAKSAIEIIKNNVSEERIEESIKRILEFKYTYLKNNLLDQSYLGSEEHQAIINKISITN